MTTEISKDVDITKETLHVYSAGFRDGMQAALTNIADYCVETLKKQEEIKAQIEAAAIDKFFKE